MATRHPDHAIRAITALTVAVTERPWSITARDLEAPRAAGLDDASILHVVLQCANFCHLNRIADAVGVDADYPDRFGAPHVEPATPSYLLPFDPPAPGAGPIALALRPGTEVYDAWQAYALDRETPALDRRRRAVIAGAVAERLGDLREQAAAEPVDALDHALIELAELTTLAPWKLGPPAYHRVRALGLGDDAEVFDAVATASSCQVFSRIAVVLAGFAR